MPVPVYPPAYPPQQQSGSVYPPQQQQPYPNYGAQPPQNTNYPNNYPAQYPAQGYPAQTSKLSSLIVM